MPQSEGPFLLKDHLFNPETVRNLADLFGLGPGWVAAVIDGFPQRELKARIDWIAQQLERELPPDFSAMAAAVEAALPPPLDPTRTDDDFGSFILAPLGVLAERHGMAQPERALDLIEALTQRFSMEFSIRPFLNAYPDLTFDRLHDWCAHSNYHVRRLVSEGTRARLPWAPRIKIDPLRPLPLLDRLHGDRTRYVTRSVANHMGDIAKFDLGAACERLADWQQAGRQAPSELDWMCRHALRAQIKLGAPAALRAIGVTPGAEMRDVSLTLDPPAPRIGSAVRICVALTPVQSGTLVVDYEMTFAAADSAGAKPAKPAKAARGQTPPRKLRSKVFKLKTLHAEAGSAVTLTRSHRFKGGARTFTLNPGEHRVTLLVNGTPQTSLAFDLCP